MSNDELINAAASVLGEEIAVIIPESDESDTPTDETPPASTEVADETATPAEGETPPSESEVVPLIVLDVEGVEHAEEIDETSLEEGTEILDLTGAAVPLVEDVADDADIGEDEVVEDLTVEDEDPVVVETIGEDEVPEEDIIEDLTVEDEIDEKKKRRPTFVERQPDFTVDVDALTSGEEGLTEGFKAKAAVIFEAAVAAKITEEKERLAEEFATKLDEAIDSHRSDLTTKVNAYLGYVVEKWAKENAVAIENTLRMEIAESFMTSLRTVFNENYIEVPQAKMDLITKLQKDNAALTESLNAEKKKNISTISTVAKLSREKIVAEASKNLTSLDAAKFKKMTDEIGFVDAATFGKKVATLVESYFSNKTGVKKHDELQKEVLSEAAPAPQDWNPMDSYLESLDRQL